MNELEVKALLDKVKAEATASIESNEKLKSIDGLSESIKSLVSKSDIDALVAKFATQTETADLLKKLEDVSLRLKALAETPAKVEGHKTLKEALVSAFSEKSVADEIKNIVASGGVQTKSLKLSVKAVGTISVDSTIGAGSTQVTITENTGIISPIRKREERYLAEVSVGSIGSNRAVWIEETDEEGTPIMIGEGDAKTQLDVQYVEQTMAVKKIAVYGKVTTELMADIPQLISYIETNLMRRMDIVLEDQLFSGNGVGDNLKGLETYATAFSAGALAGTIPSANEFDVLEAIALQVKLAFGEASAVFVHPSTMAAMKLIKDDVGRPVWKDYITIDGSMRVSGMKIVETTAVTAGDFLGGDLKVAHVLKRDELGITIGLDGNDFTQNKKTMLLEKRMVQFVSANDTPLVVTGTFIAAKADLLAL